MDNTYVCNMHTFRSIEYITVTGPILDRRRQGQILGIKKKCTLHDVKNSQFFFRKSANSDGKLDRCCSLVRYRLGRMEESHHLESSFFTQLKG